MTTHSKFLFDKGANAQKGRPNLNDLLFINTSFFNLFLPILLTVLMRLIPQANHLVFGQLEGQDPIYSTLLVGMATIFHMLIYMRQTYFYEGKGDRSVSFKVVNQVAFVLPLGIWFLAITINYPTAHLCSIFINAALLVLVFLSISVRSRHNPFRDVLQENKINRLILVAFVLFILIFIFFLIKFEELGGKDRLPAWVLIMIIFTFLVGVLWNEFQRRKKYPGKTFKAFVFQNSTINAIYIVLVIVAFIRFFGDYNKFGNGFDVLILYFLFLRMVLFCIGVFIRYFVNSKPIRFFGFKFGITILGCYLLGFISRPNKSKDQYRISPATVTRERPGFNEYIDNWFNHTSPDQPVFLISGQGGGSRAGCAFFTSVTLLDSILDKNTLAITSISGSSNGAGYYLGIKKALPQNKSFSSLIPASDPVRIKKIDSILYQKDYISNSLFKLLFTDYVRSVFGNTMNKSRNLALINEERESFLELSDSLMLDHQTFLDSTWSSVYSEGTDPTFPLFLPVSYNIEEGIKAINSPVHLPGLDMHPFYSILDSLGDKRDLRINQSILTSQIYPLISASATINGSHYLDGGVYDNLAYETLFDLYRLVAKKRDSLAASRPIILLSIVNGRYEDRLRPDRIHSELGAIGSAVTQSMFRTNPLVHKTEGLLHLNKKKDRFFELKIYKNIPEPALTLLQRIINFFRYAPDKDKVILSRFLTIEDIKDNIIKNAYRAVDSLKVDLNKFLSTPK